MIPWLLLMLTSKVPLSAFIYLLNLGLCIFCWLITLVLLNLIVRLNAAYLSVHGNAMFGRTLWVKTSSLTQQA